MKNVQTIKCDVISCQYLDNKKSLCELPTIKVSHNDLLTTMCDSYKEK